MNQISASKSFTVTTVQDGKDGTTTRMPDFSNGDVTLADDCPSTILISLNCGADHSLNNLILPTPSVWKERTLTIYRFWKPRANAPGYWPINIVSTGPSLIIDSRAASGVRGLDDYHVGYMQYGGYPIWDGRKQVYYSDGLDWWLIENVSTANNFTEAEQALFDSQEVHPYT